MTKGRSSSPLDRLPLELSQFLLLPKEVESLLEQDVVGKDIGAFQTGAEVRKVGIDGRITVGQSTP